MFVQVTQSVSSILIASFVFATTIMLLVIGFNLTSRSLNSPNFSITSVMGLGMFVTIYLFRTLNLFPYYAIPFGVITGGFVNLVCYNLIFRPLQVRGRPPELMVISSIGMMILLTGLTQALEYLRRQKIGYYVSSLVFREYDFTLFGVPFVFIFSIILTLFIIVVCWALPQTRFGMVYCAMCEKPELTQIQGVNTTRFTQWMWMISGCLAGLAGGIHSLHFYSTPVRMTLILYSVIAASLLGENWRRYGAIIGGLLLGLFEIPGTMFGKYLIGVWFGEYRVFIPFSIIVLVLSYRSYIKK